MTWLQTLIDIKRDLERQKNSSLLRPTMRRLAFLRESGLSAHGLPAVFLTGSMAWGKFFAVSDDRRPVSDIDLFAVVPSFHSSSYEAFKNVLGTEDFARLCELTRHIPVHLRVDCVVVHGPACGSDFDISLTLSTQEGFERIVRGASRTVVSWRDKPSGATGMIVRAPGSAPRSVAIEETETKLGAILSVESWHWRVADWLPTTFQQLFLPIVEKIGGCAPDLRVHVRDLNIQMLGRIETLRLRDTSWHCRHDRMPPWLQRQIRELLAMGPYPVPLELLDV